MSVSIRRERNAAIGEINDRKLELDIMKSTARALEVRPNGLASPHGGLSLCLSFTLTLSPSLSLSLCLSLSLPLSLLSISESLYPSLSRSASLSCAAFLPVLLEST